MFRICAIAIFMLFSSAATCLAAFNLKVDGAGLLAWSFVGFVALFVISHIVPAFIQCVDLFRSAFQHRSQSKNR